jgi:hypothetical protein
MVYAVTITSSTREGTTTILAISSYSVSSVVNAIMPINSIILSVPSSSGFKSCANENYKENQL